MSRWCDLGTRSRAVGRNSRTLLVGAVAAGVALSMTLTSAPAQAAGPDIGEERSPAIVSDISPPISRGGGLEAQDLPENYAFWTLQMNLCNSGHADCYQDGRSIPEAYDVIESTAPDLVTLNEVCRADVETALYPAIQQTWAGDWTFWAFLPAYDRSTGGPVECTNGDQYGVGMLGRMFAGEIEPTLQGYGDVYPAQDGDSDEMRVWLCVDSNEVYWGCTTHLAANASDTAIEQCRYLMAGVLPAVWDASGRHHSAVGGDLNLEYGGDPDVQDCVPGGWYRKGDGHYQHIMLTDDLEFDATYEIPMEYTDHNAWLVTAVAR